MTNKKLITICVTGGVVLGISMIIGIEQFNARYELRSPIQSPIVPRVKSPVPEASPTSTLQTPTPTPTMTPKPTAKPEKSAAAQGEYKYELVKHIMDATQKEVMTQIENILGREGAEVVYRESGFHPESVNSSSGACGLFQAYPCEKMKCDLTDTSCQIKWGTEYIENRYGSSKEALSFHDEHGWY